ncbi:MAG: C-GCAxxG-C-C family protein [Lachnospiraceae bacterium]|nr:C-GCAxxG-C-C family protein [Lachnospiraceae bacterium]
MGVLVDKAINNHKNFYSCSGAVLCAFADKIGIDVEQAKKIAVPYAGGKMGKCGAVMSAEYILKELYPGNVDEKINEFEKAFIAADKGSLMCTDLRGKTPGSCRACVSDSAKILEEMVG